MLLSVSLHHLQGNDDVFSFLGSVFDQVVAQFPCRYVHIGGDEVPKMRWEACDKCQARMQQVGGLTTEAAAACLCTHRNEQHCDLACKHCAVCVDGAGLRHMHFM
jgi:hypothetical protein